MHNFPNLEAKWKLNDFLHRHLQSHPIFSLFSFTHYVSRCLYVFFSISLALYLSLYLTHTLSLSLYIYYISSQHWKVNIMKCLRTHANKEYLFIVFIFVCLFVCLFILFNRKVLISLSMQKV